MLLALEKFASNYCFKDSKITYLALVGKNLHIDCSLKVDNDEIDVYQRYHLTFLGLESLSDDYFSSLDKIISRFEGTYLVSKSSFEEGTFKIDDVLKIKCPEVIIEEII